MQLVAALLGLWATDTPPVSAPSVPAEVESVGTRLFGQLSPHDRVAVGCVGTVAPLSSLVAAARGTTVLQGAGPLSETFVQAVADPAARPANGLVWLRLGDDPLVGAQTLGVPTPLALGDRWTDHWTESPRLRATRDHTLWITPHGRTPNAGQAGPEVALTAGPLPSTGCVAWSRLPDHNARLVERLVALDGDAATLRVFAASARAADGRTRTPTVAGMPTTMRHPSAVMVVYTAPHVVSGAPWLQHSEVPKRLGGLSSLIPAGYTAAPGQTRAWFDDVVGAALAVVLPVVDADQQPARVRTLLADVRDRFGLGGEIEPAGRGGRLTAGGGVAIGALPGALVLSTDPAVLSDILQDRGRAWTRPPDRPDAVAGWWLAASDDQVAVGATLSIEDQMWRVDTSGGLDALARTTEWGEL